MADLTGRDLEDFKDLYSKRAEIKDAALAGLVAKRGKELGLEPGPISQGLDWLGTQAKSFASNLAKDAMATSDVVKGGLDSLLGAKSVPEALMALPRQGLKVAEGMGQGVMDQMSQGASELKSSPLLGLTRMAVGAVPGVGAQVMRGMDRLGQLDVGGAASDFAQLGLMAKGPGLTEALGEAGMGNLGRRLVSASRKDLAGEAGKFLDREGLESVPRVGKDYAPQPGLTPAEQLRARIDSLEVSPQRGREAFPAVAKTQQVIDTAKELRNKKIAQHTEPIKVAEVIDPAYNYIKELRKAGEDSSSAEAYLANQVEHNTGIKRLKNADGEVTESPWEYVNRASLEDKGQPAMHWQEQKDLLGKLQKEVEAQKSQGEIKEGSVGSPNNVRNLLVHGVRSALENKVGPEVGEFNRTIHQTIAIQDGLREMAKVQPDTLKQAMQYVLGGAAAGGAAAVTSLGGHVPIGAGAASIGGGLLAAASVFARRLAIDPIARARFGDFLQRQAKSQIIPQTFGNVPKLRILTTSPEDK